MPFAIWGTRLLALATGYTLADVTNFFSSGSQDVSRAVSSSVLVFAGLAVGLLGYIFIFKK